MTSNLQPKNTNQPKKGLHKTKPTNYKRADTMKPMSQKAYNKLTQGQKNRLSTKQLPKKLRIFDGSESHDEIMNELDKQLNQIKNDHTNKKTHQIGNDFTK